MKKKIRWIIINIFWTATVVGGIIFDITGLQNLIYLVAAISLISGLGMLNDELKETARKSGFAFNYTVELIFDWGIALLLVYYAFWWSGVAYIIGNLMLIGTKKEF
jgi:hypothetical protein